MNCSQQILSSSRLLQGEHLPRSDLVHSHQVTPSQLYQPLSSLAESSSPDYHNSTGFLIHQLRCYQSTNSNSNHHLLTVIIIIVKIGKCDLLPNNLFLSTAFVEVFIIFKHALISVPLGYWARFFSQR